MRLELFHDADPDAVIHISGGIDVVLLSGREGINTILLDALYFIRNDEPNVYPISFSSHEPGPFFAMGAGILARDAVPAVQRSSR